MKKRKPTLGFMIMISLLFSACSAAQPALKISPTATPDSSMDQAGQMPAMSENPAKETMVEENTAEKPMMADNPAQIPEMEATATSEPMSAQSEATMVADQSTPMIDIAVPDWLSYSLNDARSGEAFTFNDFQGKVVLVEMIAVWCSNCLQQQKQVVALHAALGERDDFLSVGLDIDPNEGPETLKSFIDQNGFTWKYAVSTNDLSRQLASLYGDQFLNPPSTPMLIIDRHGGVHPLPFGIKNTEKLQQALQSFLDEGM
jgi:hypothetical protein